MWAWCSLRAVNRVGEVICSFLQLDMRNNSNVLESIYDERGPHGRACWKSMSVRFRMTCDNDLVRLTSGCTGAVSSEQPMLSREIYDGLVWYSRTRINLGGDI